MLSANRLPSWTKAGTNRTRYIATCNHGDWPNQNISPLYRPKLGLHLGPMSVLRAPLPPRLSFARYDPLLRDDLASPSRIHWHLCTLLRVPDSSRLRCFSFVHCQRIVSRRIWREGVIFMCFPLSTRRVPVETRASARLYLLPPSHCCGLCSHLYLPIHIHLFCKS